MCHHNFCSRGFLNRCSSLSLVECSVHSDFDGSKHYAYTYKKFKFSVEQFYLQFTNSPISSFKLQGTVLWIIVVVNIIGSKLLALVALCHSIEQSVWMELYECTIMKAIVSYALSLGLSSLLLNEPRVSRYLSSWRKLMH